MILRQVLFIFLILLVNELPAQSVYNPVRKDFMQAITADISIIRGNAPLYVLEGDLVSESFVTTVGLTLSYKSALSETLFWSAGLSAYSVASDFNLAPTGSDLENIVALSKFLSLPIKGGIYKKFEKFSVEISAGLEYARLFAQRERNISTTRLIILEEEMVDINRPIVQKNNIQVLTGILLSSPISHNLSSYIGVQSHWGLSDLDTSFRKQKTNRLELHLGVQYAL